MNKFFIRALIGLVPAYFTASIGAYLTWHQYILEPTLLYQVWTYYKLETPTLVWLSTSVALFGYIVFITNIKKQKTKYGSAKWGGLETIKNLELDGKNGVFMGYYENEKGKKLPLILDISLSALILAPPGTGKTTCIAIPTLLKSTNSFMVTDVKGELFRETAPTRSKFSKIRYFNPTDPRSCTFNPFAKNMLPEDVLDINGHVQNISQIILPTPKDSDPYWTNSGRSAFGFFAKWLIWKNGETSISEVRSKILSSQDIAETIQEMLFILKDADSIPEIAENPTYEKNAKTIKDKLIENGKSVLIPAESTDQWNSVMGTLTAPLDIYGDERISKATSGYSEICAKEFKETCTTVYLVINDKDIKKLAPILTLVFEITGSQLISEEPKADQIPITFMLDEFVRLGKLEQIIEMPAISRGYRVNVIFIAQDFQQIVGKYNKEQAETIYTTTAYKVVFRQNNHDTAKKLSETIGKETVIKESINNDHKKVFIKETGGSLSEEGIELVSAQFIENLPKEKSLVLGQGELKHPIYATNGFWFKDKELLDLVAKNKPRLDILLPKL